MQRTARHFRRLGMVLVLGPALALGLAACDSAEERAERHYASAVSLIEAGDADRGLVELRNVFRLNGSHREARRLYAETQLARGDLPDAFGNFLRLVEFYPDDVPARRALAELALEVREWDEALRHARAGLALAPEDAVFRGVMAAHDYRAAVQRRDEAARIDAVARAAAILAEGGAVWAAHTVIVDDTALRGTPDAAFAAVEAALAQRPEDRGMHEVRLRLLSARGDDAATEAQLRQMVALFPADTDLRDTLVGWFAQRDRIDDVVAYLRGLAEADPADPWPQLTLVQILRETEGTAPALAELDRLAEAAPDAGQALRYRTLRAQIVFQDGDAATAIDALAAVIAAAETGNAARSELRDAQVTLARMQRETGDVAAARALVDRVLAADEGHVAALQMRAAWAIEEDRTADAINALRRALAEAPRDADVMTLMAVAHLRDGSVDLAGERLALAVEVSGRGVAESLRYSRFLTDAGRFAPAEAVLTEALLVHRGHPALLAALTEFRLGRGDTERAAQSLAQLQQIAELAPELGTVAARLRAQYLEQAGDRAGALAYLEALVAGGLFDISAVAQIVQTHLANDDVASAAGYLDGLLQATPGDLSLLFLRAGVHRIEGADDEAEAIYRDLVAERPDAEGPARELYDLLSRQGRDDEAEAVLAAAIAAQPQSETLRWLLAGAQQLRGDIDAAIASYEALHAENTANDVFANNLAALLASYRATPENLVRAQTIARRLRASDVPAFRDTYGWILFQRGNAAEALPHLRFAADGLPGSGQVQYHLGRALAETGNTAEARAALEQALALGGLSDEGAVRSALGRLDGASLQ